MTDYEPVPQYNDAEAQRRAKLAEQSLVSVDKPAVSQKPTKPMRFRNMRVKKTRGRKRMRDRRNPEFY